MRHLSRLAAVLAILATITGCAGGLRQPRTIEAQFSCEPLQTSARIVIVR